MNNLSEEAYTLCTEIEKLPASEQQTKVSAAASLLRQRIDDTLYELNAFRTAEDAMHALFHAALPVGPVEMGGGEAVDGATTHDFDGDLIDLVRVLRTHLTIAREEIVRLREALPTPVVYVNGQSVGATHVGTEFAPAATVWPGVITS